MTAQLSDLLCRICLKRDELLINIYKRVKNQQTDLCTLLQRCGNIKVQKHDSYPKYLCQECTEELLISAKFRDKCDATEQAVKERCLQRLEDEGAALSKTDFARRELLIMEENTETKFNTEELKDFELIDNVVPSEEAETTAPDDDSEGTEDIKMENAEDKKSKGDYDCDKCGATFRQTKGLKIHISKQHPAADRYECDECGYCFTKQVTLKKHTCSGRKDCDLLYGGKKRHRCVYCCVYCGQCLKSATCLLEHLPQHSTYAKEASKPKRPTTSTKTKKTDKQHICSTCQRSFKHASHLELHRRAHTAESIYACTKCDRRFKKKLNLKVHERSHTGERPFVCSTCDRRFITNATLKAHERTHSPESSTFTCKPCDKTFKLKSHLTQHQLKSSTHKRNTQISKTKPKV